MPAYKFKRTKSKYVLAKKTSGFKRNSSSTYAARNRAPRATRGFFNRPGELKYSDVAAAAYAVDTVGSVTLLNGVAVGDDATNRDGRQIFNRSVHVQGILNPVDANTNNHFARIMVVWDSQPNSGTIASITDILAAQTSISNTNLNNRERFTILRDWKTAMGAVDSTATQTYAAAPTVAKVDMFINLKGVTTTYSGTTGVIGSIATGALLLVTLGSTGVGFGSAAFLSSRLRFSDS